MTVEIKQLIIKAVVAPPKRTAKAERPPAPAPARVDELVERCVQEVMRRMHRREER